MTSWMETLPGAHRNGPADISRAMAVRGALPGASPRKTSTTGRGRHTRFGKQTLRHKVWHSTVHTHYYSSHASDHAIWEHTARLVALCHIAQLRWQLLMQINDKQAWAPVASMLMIRTELGPWFSDADTMRWFGEYRCWLMCLNPSLVPSSFLEVSLRSSLFD